MKTQKILLLLCGLLCCMLPLAAQKPATNPVIYADVPDMSMLRVGDTYYMSSTTMHMSPGVPIMKSKDLVNWEIVNYAYDTLADIPVMNLDNGENTYGRGSWASCLRYHKGLYYLSTFAQTTGKTYFYITENLEKGPWKRTEFSPAYHDHSFFFDDDGHIYMIYGNGKLFLAELEPDLSGVKPGTERVLIENASAPAGDNIMLGAEGSQLFKVNGKYYLFNIAWPHGGVRTVIVHRADKITGPYEGRVVFQDRGIAQGGLVDTPDGCWFAYLFEDCGSVGRIPYLVPVEWKDGWPVLGVEGRAPVGLELPDSRGLIPGIVNSDGFSRKKGERALPLVWQWNHNPDNSLWSLSARKGYLRLTTGRVETSLMQARNTLTQRTIGPVCSGSVGMDVSGMKEGDFAGLALFQRKYGQVGVKVIEGKKYIVMVNGAAEQPVEVEKLPLEQRVVYLKAACDFRGRADKGYFYYSLDGKEWKAIGNVLGMEYTLPHFMGYRFALFNYATKEMGGYADFDYFEMTDRFPELSGASELRAECRDKQRLIVTTDLGGTDPDDVQSMIHLLLCSNMIDIEGLISSQVWMDDSDKTDKIRKVVEAFGQVLPRLKKHADGYPDIDYLRSVIRRGQEKSNMSGVGEGKDSPGSELIIETVDRENDGRPVWVAAWGGMNTVAQALWKVRNSRSGQAFRKFAGKIRIYDVLGQDDAGAWIAKEFPEIMYIRNKEVYGWAPSDEWIKRNIQSCKPLGEAYPDRMWATEGDSPSFLYVYANGLNVPEHIDYGGWGGRFSTEKASGVRGMDFIVKSGKDETQYDPYYMYASSEEGIGAINRWKQHIWNNFAARILWTTTDDYSAVNHHPVAVVDGDRSLQCIYKRVKAGSSFCLDASMSADPDGDSLDYNWSVYREPGTYKGTVGIEGKSTPLCKVTVPSDASGKSFHIILELTDKGVPALTAYRRIVVNVD